MKILDETISAVGIQDSCSYLHDDNGFHFLHGSVTDTNMNKASIALEAVAEILGNVFELSIALNAFRFHPEQLPHMTQCWLYPNISEKRIDSSGFVEYWEPFPVEPVK